MALGLDTTGIAIGNMILSIKLEVYKILQLCESKIKPQPQATCTENLVMFGHMVPEICSQTDTQTCSSQYSAPLQERGGVVMTDDAHA